MIARSGLELNRQTRADVYQETLNKIKHSAAEKVRSNLPSRGRGGTKAAGVLEANWMMLPSQPKDFTRDSEEDLLFWG